MRKPMFENEMCEAAGLRATCNSCDRIIFEDENWKEQYKESGGYCSDCLNDLKSWELPGTATKYKIERECWNENTFNGYTDNPYWMITHNGNQYGLTDSGNLWSISNLVITEHTKDFIRQVIRECKLNIQI